MAATGTTRQSGNWMQAKENIFLQRSRFMPHPPPKLPGRCEQAAFEELSVNCDVCLVVAVYSLNSNQEPGVFKWDRKSSG